MPFRYLDDVATADVAFVAWGDTLEDLFVAAADAALNVMVNNLDSVADRKTVSFSLEDADLDMLLFQFLQEIVFYKDAQQMLLRTAQLTVEKKPHGFCLHSQMKGEQINPDKHHLHVDIKAVTLHHLKVEQTQQGWDATVVLDI